MLDIGIQEFVILMVLALLVFGPDKLPDLGRRLGRAMREFRRASDEFRSTIETNFSIHDELPLPPSAATTATTDPVAPTAEVALDPTAGPAEGETALAPPPEGPGESAVPAVAPVEPFCAQRGGRLLHRSACAWAARIPDADRIVLKTAAEGVEMGLAACPVCGPTDADLPA